MIYKSILIISITLVFVKGTICCLSAHQDRLIPLGTVEDKFLAVEIIAYRYGKGEFGAELFRSYKINLKCYFENYMDSIVYSLDSNKELKKEELEGFLREQVLKAIKICNEIDKFQIFTPMRV